jgi:hypothetical protein
MSINTHYVWAGIITWTALSFIAMVFVHGGSHNKIEGE